MDLQSIKFLYIDCGFLCILNPYELWILVGHSDSIYNHALWILWILNSPNP